MPECCVCDNCQTMSNERWPHGWLRLMTLATRDRELTFCSEPCLIDYYMAKRLIEGLA